MRIFKIILLVFIVTFWIFGSAVYLLLGEWAGFCFMQLLFVPLISGLIMLYKNRILGIINLSFWSAIIYGFVNFPFRDIVKFIPVILFFAYFIHFALIVKDSLFKIMGWTFSALLILIFIRVLKIQGMFDTDLLLAVGFFMFPIIIFYKSIEVLRTQKTIGITLIVMAIIAFTHLLAHVFFILGHLDISSVLLNSLFILVILSLGIAAYITRNKSEYININSVILAYFICVLFGHFTLWVRGTLYIQTP